MIETVSAEICKDHKLPLSLFCANESCQMIVCPECVDSHKCHQLMSLKGMKSNIEEQLMQQIQRNEEQEKEWSNKEAILKTQNENFKTKLQTVLDLAEKTFKIQCEKVQAEASVGMRQECQRLEEEGKKLLEEIAKQKGRMKESAQNLLELKAAVKTTNCESLIKFDLN